MTMSSPSSSPNRTIGTVHYNTCGEPSEEGYKDIADVYKDPEFAGLRSDIRFPAHGRTSGGHP